MLNKIFLIFLAVSIVVLSVLTFLPYWQLQSIGFPPAEIVEKFRYFENIQWLAIWITSGILLILANVILWTYKKGWALWTTLAYFAIFTMLNMWWLSVSLSDYQARNNLPTDGFFSKNGVFGILLCGVVGVGIFFNQFLGLRLRERMYGTPQIETVDRVALDEPAIVETDLIENREKDFVKD